MNRITISILVFLCLISSGCEKPKLEPGPDADSQGHSKASEFTVKANAHVLTELPFHDQQDFEDARRGLIASDPDFQVKNELGELIWNQPAYAFMGGVAPPTVNPSLWRQAQLNNIHGLFKVTDGIYQVRGYDLANMTIIEGETGWIIVDPLTAKETATAALQLARGNLGDKPVVAIIFTHSHVDHFGGVLGILSAEEAANRGVRIIAPVGFMEEATSENLIAGTAMGRRAMYMYGKRLARSERGHVGSGLGKGPAFGSFGILEPTEIVDHTPQEMVIDGVRIVFQNAPGSEAPAELTFYLPDRKAFGGAEVVSHTLHNLYTLRGAKVRDALKWSNYIGEMIELFGDAEIFFGGHHWPKWGNAEILDFLRKQRDLYKYIHDQSVRLLNEGLTPLEIADQIELPESLRTSFANRDYYGTVRHNARAVYQAYLGWYDGNPARLNPLAPEEAGARYIELMGGGEAVLAKAQASFGEGQYRWVAELLNHLVFAEPGNAKAKGLLARTYDQLGYQSESGPWRDVYLSGAYELRHGGPEKGVDISLFKDVLKQTPVSYFFDTMAVRLNGPDAEGKAITVKIVFSDIGESHELSLENAVLHHKAVGSDSPADATLVVTYDLFIRMMIGQAGLKDTLFSDELEVEGSKIDLMRFFSLFDKPKGTFSIVTP
jgi:alkyl sulfatase BDS1-like metallo-beta-lactamase superfamily hydrolase